MKKTILTLSFCAFALTLSAQDISQFKEIPVTDAVNGEEYINGNKYQKDAVLFVELLRKTMMAWVEAGHKDQLYMMPQKKVQVPEHEYFQGKVAFIQGPKTFSSAGILITILCGGKKFRKLHKPRISNKLSFAKLELMIIPNNTYLCIPCGAKRFGSTAQLSKDQ